MWRKTCKLFDVYIEEVETSKFVFDITNADGAQIYEQDMGAASTKEAFQEADALIWEFIVAGVEKLSGIRIVLDRPPNEVRFKSMVLQDNILHGLDEDGVLYREEEIIDPSTAGRFKKKVWVRVSMERHNPTY